MANTMKIRVLRPVLVYRPGCVLPSVPRGQALEWIRRGIAVEVADEPEAVETADVEQRTETAAMRHAKRRRGQ